MIDPLAQIREIAPFRGGNEHGGNWGSVLTSSNIGRLTIEEIGQDGALGIVEMGGALPSRLKVMETDLSRGSGSGSELYDYILLLIRESNLDNRDDL